MFCQLSTTIRERTRAGLGAARARGRGGGPRKRLGEEQRRHAVELYRSRQPTVKEICALVGVSRSKLYAYVEEFAEGGGTAALIPASGWPLDATAVERTCGTCVASSSRLGDGDLHPPGPRLGTPGLGA